MIIPGGAESHQKKNEECQKGAVELERAQKHHDAHFGFKMNVVIRFPVEVEAKLLQS